ncbi:MAG TPA: hypothetical protein VF103_10525 [Polyangiaceae bacterium]
MVRNTCEIVVGRLVEIDIAAGFNEPNDIDDQIKLIVGALEKVPAAQKVVIVADWRPCKVFTPETAERAIKLFTNLNARIERSGILHRFDQPTSVLQVLRLIRETHFDRRRVFTQPDELYGWLDPVLDANERDRLRTFFAKHR